MKPASALLQIVALAALFAAHVAAPEDFRMPGARRALETISRTAAPAALPDRLTLPSMGRVGA